MMKLFFVFTVGLLLASFINSSPPGKTCIPYGDDGIRYRLAGLYSAYLSVKKIRRNELYQNVPDNLLYTMIRNIRN
jgi:hypothetical protein